jgi:hypothetical protein
VIEATFLSYGGGPEVSRVSSSIREGAAQFSLYNKEFIEPGSSARVLDSSEDFIKVSTPSRRRWGIPPDSNAALERDGPRGGTRPTTQGFTESSTASPSMHTKRVARTGRFQVEDSASSARSRSSNGHVSNA